MFNQSLATMLYREQRFGMLGCDQTPVVERMSEEGAVLLKNDAATLPISHRDVKGGIMVAGPGAEYTIADPTNEASVGFADRDAINPLEQMQSFSHDPSAFDYVPANSPSASRSRPRRCRPRNTSVTGGLNRTTGPGSPATDHAADFTTASPQGQLTPGS